MSTKRKLAFIDVETTGLDPERHDVIHLAAYFEVDGEVVAKFNERFRAHEGTSVSAEALATNNLTLDEVRSWPDPALAYRKWIDVMGQHVHRYDKADKWTFVAYNARFDSDFIRRWMDRCSHGEGFYGAWFWHPPLCVYELAAFALQDLRGKIRMEQPDWKLPSVARAVGIQVDEDQLHQANVDIELTRLVWQKLEACRTRLDRLTQPTASLPPIPA